MKMMNMINKNDDDYNDTNYNYVSDGGDNNENDENYNIYDE